MGTVVSLVWSAAKAAGSYVYFVVREGTSIACSTVCTVATGLWSFLKKLISAVERKLIDLSWSLRNWFYSDHGHKDEEPPMPCGPLRKERLLPGNESFERPIRPERPLRTRGISRRETMSHVTIRLTTPADRTRPKTLERRRNGSRNRAKGLRTRSCAIIPDSQSVERRAEGTRESEALKPVQVRCLKETSLPTTPERQASKTFGKLTASSTFPPTAFTTTAFTGVSSSSVSSGSTDDDDDDEDEWVKLPRQHGWALLPRRGLDANTIPHLEPEAGPRRRATVSLLFQGHRRRKQGQLGQHRHDDEDASSPADKASATTVRRGRGLSGNASKRPNVPYSTLQAVLFRCTVAKNGWLSSKDSYPVRRLDKSRSVHNATSNRAATL